MITDMLRGLETTGVRFVVLGGVAGRLHGSPHITDDLYICIDTEPENVRRLAGVLDSWNSWNARLRIGRDQGDEGAGLPFVLDEHALTEIPIFTLTTDQGRIDVMHSVPGVGHYTACKHRSERFDARDSHFDALDLDALIDSKRSARRNKDQLHLVELDALRDLERAEPIDRG